MSHDRQVVSRERPGQVITPGPPHQGARFPLDYASWRAHLAAPGSRFEPAPSASPRIVHFDAATDPATSANADRHAA